STSANSSRPSGRSSSSMGRGSTSFAVSPSGRARWRRRSPQWWTPDAHRVILLYDSPVSGNCYKVRLLLAHLEIPYERRTMDVVDRSNRREVLGDLNPSLRVP